MSAVAHPLLPGRIAFGEGRYAHFLGLGTRYLIEAHETGGAFAVVEHDLAPRALGAPLHRHEREDEISFVTRGRLGVKLGDDLLVAGPGDVVRKPRHQWHAFWNAGDEECRFYELITPGAFAEYFADLEGPLGQQPPDFEALGAIRARYELDMDMESAGALAAAHGLAG
jgi:mannose-6-phosphate isomerase-like protein (cupin superfamily)